MKRFAFAALIALSFSVEAGAQPSARPDFSFKQAVAGQEMNPNAVGQCQPSRDGPGVLECRGSDPTVAGVRLLVPPNYYFYNNRLTAMFFLFDARGADYLTFLNAFTDRYGAPCETETKRWQSRGGATYDNPTATWCFRTGRLELEQLGPSLDYGSVTYTDDYSAPSRETPRDF